MMMCQKEVHSSLLIGCTKRVVELTDQDHMKVSTSVSLPRTEVSTVASITARCFLKDLDYGGVTLSTNDHIIIQSDGTEAVVCIKRFLSVRCQGQDCQMLGEGTVKPFHLNDNGHIVVSPSNGFPKVENIEAKHCSFWLKISKGKSCSMTVGIIQQLLLTTWESWEAFHMNLLCLSTHWKMTCYLSKEKSLGTLGMAKYWVLMGYKVLMSTSLLRNPSNQVFMCERGLGVQQGTLSQWIQWLELHVVTGLMQIVGRGCPAGDITVFPAWTASRRL